MMQRKMYTLQIRIICLLEQKRYLYISYSISNVFLSEMIMTYISAHIYTQGCNST